MIISHSMKFAFARTHGCGDNAVELFLRKHVLRDGDVATAMPFFGLEPVGSIPNGLSAFSTAKEIRAVIGDEYKIFAVVRNPPDALKSNYNWLLSIGRAKGSFEDFVKNEDFNLRESAYRGADVLIDFENLLTGLADFLTECGCVLPKSPVLSLDSLDAIREFSPEMLGVLRKHFPEWFKHALDRKRNAPVKHEALKPKPPEKPEKEDDAVVDDPVEAAVETPVETSVVAPSPEEFLDDEAEEKPQAEVKRGRKPKQK